MSAWTCPDCGRMNDCIPTRCPCGWKRDASEVETAARALVAMVRHGNVQIHGDEAGIAAWDHLDALLFGAPASRTEETPPGTCPTCGHIDVDRLRAEILSYDFGASHDEQGKPRAAEPNGSAEGV